MNGIDDDENGLIDCEDPMCSFVPKCASGTAFSFVAVENDNTPPIIMLAEVERLSDSAFMKADTNEPSNLTLSFYYNDSSCKTLNISLDDIGIGYQANANFKPFHSIDLMIDNLGYDLINGTTYYYKIKVCDPSSNCAISACSNFTTKTSNVEKSFIFKMDLPAGYTVDIPALNKTDYNFSEQFGNAWYDVGIKTNTSMTKSMNFTVHCGSMSIGFFGVNMLKPTKLDLTDAFVCDTANNLMGMNSSLKKWNKLINELKLSGATDYIEVTIPVAYSTSNTINWTDDSGNSGQDVDDYVECIDGGSSNTICKIPVSMGFSAYTVSVPPTSGDDGSTSSSGGGGGGGGSTTGKTYVIEAKQFNAGYSKALSSGERIKFSVSNEYHYVTMDSIIGQSVKINVTSTLQQKILSVGDEKKFELDGDDYYDLSVIFNGIVNTTMADLTIKSINEKIIVDEESDAGGISGEVVSSGSDEGEEIVLKSEKSLVWLWILIGIIIVLVVVIIIYKIKKK